MEQDRDVVVVMLVECVNGVYGLDRNGEGVIVYNCGVCSA